MAVDELDEVAERLRAAGSDFSRIWAAVADRAADIVEIRHIPPSRQLDGFRPRDGFIAYVEEEARALPRSFRTCAVGLDIERSGDTIVWNPLSLSGPLLGSGRNVDIRFRVELHFSHGRLHRVDGSPTAENSKADIIDWLKSVELAGGFNPPPPLPESGPGGERR